MVDMQMISHKTWFRRNENQSQLSYLPHNMPGRKISPKTVAAAGEAAAKLNPSNATKTKPTATPVVDERATKVHSSKPKKETAPKKEVEYVVYKVDAEKPKATAAHVHKKEDLSMLNTSLKDSAIAKSKQGKNVKQLAPKKKMPTLPHHHGGPAPTKTGFARTSE